MKNNAGFSLIELMIALAVGMITVLSVTYVFAGFESYKRTTTSGNSAQENGLLGLFSVERDARQAGFGIQGSLQCATINMHNENASPQDFTLSGLPITITRNSPSSGTDQVEILLSGSSLGSIPSTIQQDMPDSSSILRVDRGFGFSTGNLVILAQPPKDCSVVQLSQDAQHTGTANDTAPGTMWDLQHNPGGCCDFNPPGGHNIFPSGGYTKGAKAANLGNLVVRRYFVQSGQLVLSELNMTTGAFDQRAIASGILALRAEYGRDTNADDKPDAWDTNTSALATAPNQLVAVRLAIVAQTDHFERTTSDSPYGVFELQASVDPGVGNSISLSGAQQQYRYKTYSTTVPLRNVIWNN